MKRRGIHNVCASPLLLSRKGTIDANDRDPPAFSPYLCRAGAFAVEINRYRCQTLRLNFPLCKIFEGPIQQMMLANYPAGPIPIFFITLPCDRYTLAAHIHGTCTGDALYLEALREIVLRYPEIVILEMLAYYSDPG